MISARHGALAPGILALLLVTACDPTASDPGTDAVPAAARVDSLTAELVVLDSTGLDRLAAVRAEVEATLGIPLFPASGDDPLPAHLEGAVVARDATTRDYVLAEDPADAVPAGIRVRAYHRDDAGAFVIPLNQAGHFDFTEGSGASGPFLGLTAVLSGETLYDLEDRSLRDEAVVRLVGAIGPGGDTDLDLSIEVEENPFERLTGIDFFLASDARDFEIDLVLNYYDGGSTGNYGGDITLTATNTANADYTLVEIYGQLLTDPAGPVVEGFAYVQVPGADSEPDPAWVYDVTGPLTALQMVPEEGTPPAGIAPAVGRLLARVLEAAAAIAVSYDVELPVG